LPVLGTETFSEDLSMHAGGGAFITAAAFRALGWQSSILATLPAAPFDAIVCKDILDCDVDTTYCVQAAKGTAPQVTVAITNEDDRAFLSHKTGAALPEINLVKGDFQHLHIGELRSLVEHPDLLEKARNAGMTISADCGWDSDLLANGLGMENLLSKVDVFLPNKKEHDLLIASGLPEGTAPLTVIKCGSEGSVALENGVRVIEPVIAATVVDATGAGDAFNGGFLSSWLLGEPLSVCLSVGNQCGRGAVQKAGGTGGILDCFALSD
jgi:sugar/nucleoside kinase (ribokinase family)